MNTENTPKKGFVNSVLSEDGDKSSKRVIGVSGFVILSVALILQIILKFEAPADNLVSAIEYITMAAIFGTVVEKFKYSNFRKSRNNSLTNNAESNE